MNQTLPLFTESPACTKRIKCGRCRSEYLWRKSLLNLYTLPGDDINFDCPHGVPWPEGKKPGSVKATAKKARGLPGPGDVAKQLIETIYGIEQVGCRCKGLQKWMNEKGWLWCLRHKREVTEKLIEHGKELGLLIDAAGFWQAHRELRRKLRREAAKG